MLRLAWEIIIWEEVSSCLLVNFYHHHHTDTLCGKSCIRVLFILRWTHRLFGLLCTDKDGVFSCVLDCFLGSTQCPCACLVSQISLKIIIIKKINQILNFQPEHQSNLTKLPALLRVCSKNGEEGGGGHEMGRWRSSTQVVVSWNISNLTGKNCF